MKSPFSTELEFGSTDRSPYLKESRHIDHTLYWVDTIGSSAKYNCSTGKITARVKRRRRRGSLSFSHV